MFLRCRVVYGREMDGDEERGGGRREWGVGSRVEFVEFVKGVVSWDV